MPEKPILASRFAPSPTGYLHLGNAWAFLITWLAVRSSHGRLILRMEDIDQHRSRAAYADAILQDLSWLGLDWDAGPDAGPDGQEYRQSRRSHIYAEALRRLAAQDAVFPCFCSRRDLRSIASAPHAEDAAPVYPGTCNRLSAWEVNQRLAQKLPHSQRFRHADIPVTFEDRIMGLQTYTPEAYGGQFAILRADGVWSYQLATAVDDSLMDINLVIRGRDLLPSTPRQILLQRALGLPVPDYAHLPLLLDESGERLAKRHSSLTLASLRESGIQSRRIIGFFAHLAGLQASVAPCSPEELLSHFSMDKLPRHDIRIDQDALACMS